MSVSIIVVNYNGKELLEPCLAEATAQAAELGGEVMLVDNASADGSAEFVRSRFPTVRLVRNARNEGFAEGCNVGVRAAHGDTIVLVNNDAVPNPGWLKALLRALEPADVAVACSVIHDPRFPDEYAVGTGSLSVIGHPIPNVAIDAEHPFYATGCSLAFKRALFGEPFEAIYFAYYEDALLSWRAHLRGYRVARSLASSVEHLGSRTAATMPTIATFYYERNKLMTPLLCFEAATLARLFPLYLFDGLARAVEDFSRIVRLEPDPHPRAAVAHYSLLFRALGWLICHPGTVARMRRRVQTERTVGDSAIVPMLSSKIFDDHVPTRAHSVANMLSTAYCKLVGLRSAEVATTGARVAASSSVEG